MSLYIFLQDLNLLLEIMSKNVIIKERERR